MDHKSKNSQLCSTSVVQLNSTLGELGLFVEVIPSEVDESVTEVTGELSLSGYILHDSKLKESYEKDELGNSGIRDGVDGGPTVRDGVEGISGFVDSSWKMNSGTGPLTMDGITSTRRPSFPSVESSSTMGVPLCWEFLDLWYMSS